MIEINSIYKIITHVGNSEKLEPVLPLYSKEAGGNADSWKKYQIRKQKYEALQDKRNRWFGNTSGLVSYVFIDNYSRFSLIKRKSISFMCNSDKWADVFLDEVFGSVKSAFWKTESRVEVEVAFLSWFDDKRRELRRKMEKENQQLVPKKEEIVIKKSSKSIGSHGGVANLLKVLTKTMEKQGADIQSIAKVQYEICKQAGIYIPDEFIEDVAVVLNAIGQLD